MTSFGTERSPRSHAPLAAVPVTSSTPQFAGSSPLHLSALRQVKLLGPFEHASVLLEGETGTGKSYFARELHNCSPRAGGPFHQVLLSALDDNLASSDLFGHVSGAYTDARHNRPGHFVTANKGTLFLDEIGKTTRRVQQKLLHAIEHREITPVGTDRSLNLDVRIVAATNIPLAVLVERGEVIDDLAARLASFRISIPALRERCEDIPALVHQFVELRAPRCGHAGSRLTVSEPLMKTLMRADWPHNLRQLDGVVQRLLMHAAVDGSATIGLEHATGALAWLRELSEERPVKPTAGQLRERIATLGTVTAAAESFGISRCTVYRYLGRGESSGG